MRLFVALAALASVLVAFPAAAQKAKPEPTILGGVVAEPDKPEAPPPVTDKENLWVLDLSDGGRVTILLRPDIAPKMVTQVKTLTRRHFYDGSPFHRVIDAPEAMAQSGMPGAGSVAGSDLPDVPAEFSRVPHVRGVVSAARLGAPENATPEQIKKAEDSANSQFFIMFSPRLSFDQKYTVFGRVISGMEWVDLIQRGEPPANPTRILHAYIASDNPPDYRPEAPQAVLPAGEKAVTLPGTTPSPPQ